MPDRDNRQKGRPPRGVDDMGGVVLRKRGMWVVLGGWGLERFGFGDRERLKAAAAWTEVERADWLLCNVTTHHLLVYRMISELCRYVRLRHHPHSCPRIEETCST